MYIAPGISRSEIGDIDVFVHEDAFHVFHLCLPSHDRVGHLVSTDGVSWDRLPDALCTGEPGDFDDDQIWTMGVFTHGGAFFMLYTGLATAENGLVQRIGLATSRDLVRWTKHGGNPVAVADPRWYETEWGPDRRVDWRDPQVFVENGLMHALVSARENAGPSARRGCAGHLTSADGYRWEVQPPLLSPRVSYDFEVPCLFAIGSLRFITGICGRNAVGTNPAVYRVADSLRGPYRRTADDVLLPGENNAFKPCAWRGRTLLFHWLRSPADWGAGGDTAVCALAPPKVAEAAGDSLVLRPFEEWESAARGGWEAMHLPSILDRGTRAGGEWALDGHRITGACPRGLGAFFLPGEMDDFILEAHIEAMGARELGLVFRSDPRAEEASFAAVIPGRDAVELATLARNVKHRGPGIGYAWRGRTPVQTNHFRFPPSDATRVRLVAYGPYVELSLDGTVALSALTMKRRSGLAGFFAEDGNIGIGDVRIRSLRAPGNL